MDVFLQTARLRLRRFTTADADYLVALDGDPEVMRYLTNGKPTPREVVEREMLPSILWCYERSEAGRWAAEDLASGEFLGWLSLQPPKDGSTAELDLGYRLRRSAWGRGYAAEGARALIRKAFTDLGTQRVFAQTMAVNTRSRRVMESAGLRYLRTFHLQWDDPIPGTEHGEVEYELLREGCGTQPNVGAECGGEPAAASSYLGPRPGQPSQQQAQALRLRREYRSPSGPVVPGGAPSGQPVEQRCRPGTSHGGQARCRLGVCRRLSSRKRA